MYDPSIEIICFVGGYKGLLKGEYLTVGPEVRSYLTQSVSQVVLRESIPAKIRQVTLCYY